MCLAPGEFEGYFCKGVDMFWQGVGCVLTEGRMCVSMGIGCILAGSRIYLGRGKDMSWHGVNMCLGKGVSNMSY